jgi:hypothetical protein
MSGVAPEDNRSEFAEAGTDRGDDPADLATLDAVAAALADAVESAVPGWVERCVGRLVGAYRGEADSDLAAAAADAGQRAAAEVGRALRALLATDVDVQRTNPLSVLRSAVKYPTEVLEAAGVPPVVRGEFEERAFPDDVYDLAPATWADVDPGLQELGIVWGAAKAHVVLARRRRDGKR